MIYSHLACIIKHYSLEQSSLASKYCLRKNHLSKCNAKLLTRPLRGDRKLNCTAVRLQLLATDSTIQWQEKPKTESERPMPGRKQRKRELCFVVSLARSMKRYGTTNGITVEVAQTSMKLMTIPIRSDTVSLLRRSTVVGIGCCVACGVCRNRL